MERVRPLILLHRWYCYLLQIILSLTSETTQQYTDRNSRSQQQSLQQHHHRTPNCNNSPIKNRLNIGVSSQQRVAIIDEAPRAMDIDGSGYGELILVSIVQFFTQNWSNAYNHSISSISKSFYTAMSLSSTAAAIAKEPRLWCLPPPPAEPSDEDLSIIWLGVGYTARFELSH